MLTAVDKKLTRTITWMAAFMSAVAGLGLPLAFFGLSYSYQHAALETEAEINGRIVTQLINANPEMWKYEDLRLLEVMRRRPGKGIPETRRVRDLEDAIVAESAEVLDAPVQTKTAPLLDSGRQVGTIEISRSLRPLLNQAALLALAGSVLGIAGFVTLRTIPLRLLRRALGSLYEEKERAQVTLHSIGDGVITTDAEGKVVLLNPVAEDLTGWSLQEAAGMPLAEVFCIVNEKTRAACESPVAQVLREQRTIELANHTILVAKNGTERVIADSGAPIRGADGRIIGVVLVFRDVTEKQQLLEEMQKAAKLDSLGVLAGGIAHNFNNILTTIMGNISLAQLETRPEDLIHDKLDSAEAACFRAKELTHQLLTFAKGGTPVKQAVSLEELIRSSSDFALTGSNVLLDIEIAGDLGPVSADAGQINQVIHNLVINAVEAMPEGGVVAIRGKRTLLGTGSMVPLPAGEYAHIAVKDQGAGVPRELFTRIFDPYFTTKKGGSGLGLATCYSIVRNHGGHIRVSSEPGSGSLFEVFLPLASVGVSPERERPADTIVRGKGTILVMDDEESICVTVGKMLTVLGYEAVFVKNGPEAIDWYRQARASGRPFDAVILDLTIPGGMGGRETLLRLRELDSGVKAIVSSGYSENPVMSHYAEHGFKDVISKPFDVKQMSLVLHRVLRGGSQPAS